MLGYANPRKAISDHCKEKGVTKRYTLSSGGEQETIIINESNLYRLIIKSKKPEAERFERWVMEEVLPSIRKTGGYSTGQRTNEHRDRLLLVKLAKELKFETCAPVRTLLSEQITALCLRLGVGIPDYSQIGHQAPPQPDRVTEFFDLLDELRDKGEVFNHATAQDALAFNLPEIKALFAKHRFDFNFHSIYADLRLATSPKFMDMKAVNSGLRKRSVKCWVFGYSVDA